VNFSRSVLVNLTGEETDTEPSKIYGRTSIRSPEAAITNLRWLPMGRQSVLAAVDAAGTLGLWDFPRVQEPRNLLKISGKTELNALAFSHDGSKLFVAGKERAVKIYDVASGLAVGVTERQVLGDNWSGLGRIMGHTSKVLSLCSDPSCSDVFMSGGFDKQVLLWDLRTGTSPAAVIKGTELGGDALDLSRDGRTLFAASHRVESPLQLFDLRMLSPRLKEVVASSSYRWCGSAAGLEKGGGQGDSCMVFSAAWDAFNGTIVAAGEKDSVGQVFRRPQQDPFKPLEVVATFQSSGCAMYAAAVSDDARNAAFGGADGSVRISDLRHT